MLHFEGDKEFPQAPADIFTRLGDARFLVQCVPELETVKESEPDKAVFTLRPGVSFVRGTLELTVRIAERVPAASLRLLIHSKGIGSTSDVEAAMLFTPQ